MPISFNAYAITGVIVMQYVYYVQNDSHHQTAYSRFEGLRLIFIAPYYKRGFESI